MKLKTMMTPLLAVAAAVAITTATTSRPVSVRTAMDRHRKAHPRCAVCEAKRSINGNRCEVHHIQPQSFRPDLAADPQNFVTLCRRHHFWLGHMSNFKHANTNLLATIHAVRAAYSNNAMRGVKP